MGNPSDIDEIKRPGTFGVRHVQAILLLFGLMLCFSMRVNMSMAIVSMTDETNDNSFDWSMQTQSVILSSFFWGYVVLQTPGGMMVSKFGGKLLLTISLGINSVITLLIPLAAGYGGWKMVCACRITQGLAQGFIFPTTHHLIGQWVPLSEKSRLGTLIYAGGQLGTAMQLIASGYIANYWGWPSIFYVNGSLGVLWVAFYVFLGSSSPKTSTVISEDERRYIEASLGHGDETEKKHKIPWKSIVTSLPFLSLLIVHMGQNWGFWTLMTEIPSYMNKVLGVDIKQNGVMSATPYLTMYILSFPMGFISDYMINKKWLSVTAARKVSNSVGLFGPAFALIGLSYAPEGNITAAVVLLSAVVGLNAGHYTGFMLVHIDMAPNFAGTLMGITNCCANIISIIAPLVAGAIIHDETDPAEWRKVFYLASTFYICSNLIFVIFGTSERQKWNEPDDHNCIESGSSDSTSQKKAEKVV